MSNINSYRLKQLTTKFIFLALVAITLTTSTAGFIKVAKSYNSKDKLDNLPEVQIANSQEGGEVLGVENEPGNTGSQQPTNTSNQTNFSPSPTPKTPQPILSSPTKLAQNPLLKPVVPTTTPTQNTTNPNACLITLWGQQYDVTSLRDTHSGGDVFVCGTDMTAVYQSQHGTNLSRMQSYLVDAAGNTNGGGQTAGNNDDDHEDDEDEDDDEDRLREEIDRAREEHEDEDEDGED